MMALRTDITNFEEDSTWLGGVAGVAIKFYGSRAGIYICYDSGYGRVREREMK